MKIPPLHCLVGRAWGCCRVSCCCLSLCYMIGDLCRIRSPVRKRASLGSELQWRMSIQGVASCDGMSQFVLFCDISG